MQNSKIKTHTSILSRIPIYILGVFVLGFGIVLCVKCGLGVSPINSIPYVVTHFVPLSLGTISIFFYLINMLLQFILSDKKYYGIILLQLPVSFAFGFAIDMWDAILPSADTIATRIIFLCGSLFFTALGIMLIVSMHLVPDPPTGTVQAISRAAKKKIGSTKVRYDCACVIISLLISLLCTHKILGFGIATIASAFFVGRILALLQSTAGKKLRMAFPVTEG